MIEYTSGLKTLDKVSLDTSFTQDIEFQTKAQGLRVPRERYLLLLVLDVWLRASMDCLGQGLEQSGKSSTGCHANSV